MTWASCLSFFIFFIFYFFYPNQLFVTAAFLHVIFSVIFNRRATLAVDRSSSFDQILKVVFIICWTVSGKQLNILYFIFAVPSSSKGSALFTYKKKTPIKPSNLFTQDQRDQIKPFPKTCMRNTKNIIPLKKHNVQRCSDVFPLVFPLKCCVDFIYTLHCICSDPGQLEISSCNPINTGADWLSPTVETSEIAQ